VIRQLIARGAVAVESGQYATLALVEDKARPILRGEAQVMLRNETKVSKEPARSRRSDAAPVATSKEAETLFEALRQWRAMEAKAQKLPPYVIFQDVVLREIAAVRPASLNDLGVIKGVGASKLGRYGEDVLAVVRAAG
jgi:ATP-dependent DNA helicase RecQ